MMAVLRHGTAQVCAVGTAFSSSTSIVSCQCSAMPDMCPAPTTATTLSTLPFASLHAHAAARQATARPGLRNSDTRLSWHCSADRQCSCTCPAESACAAVRQSRVPPW